jgi:peptidoglycan pentaglycine glycine transferase (the first glycine)
LGKPRNWKDYMQTCLLDKSHANAWNTLLLGESFFPMLQSWSWGEVKSRLGWDAYRVGVLDGNRILAGAQLLIRHLPLGIGSLAYIPRGPIGNWADPEIAGALFNQIHSIACQQHAVYLKVEPAVSASPETQNLLLHLGFHNSPVTNQPCATILMDISPAPETILRNMRDSTRRKIQSTERKGVSARIGTLADLPTFYRLMQITAQRAGFALRSYEYYATEFETFFRKEQAALFLAEYQGQVIAAHIAYSMGNQAAFFHQTSSCELPALNPNCLLVWEEVQWAKSKGCRTYDLWGIPDEIVGYVASGQEPGPDRTDGLWGVYRFKSGFSKNIATYIGALDYVYSPLLYRLLDNKFLNQGMLEKISSWLDKSSFRQRNINNATR